MKLSEDLKYWRAERPDEWTMDCFIRNAKKLEEMLDKAWEALIEANACGYDNELRKFMEGLNGS